MDCSLSIRGLSLETALPTLYFLFPFPPKHLILGLDWLGLTFAVAGSIPLSCFSRLIPIWKALFAVYTINSDN